MSNPRLRFISWLIERHPRAYFAWKRIGKHRLCEDREFLALHAAALRSGEGLQVLEERYNLWALTRAVARLPGDYAEVGVYRGGSARFIAAAKGPGKLHLFDTFQGMPAVDPSSDGAFHAGQFGQTSLEHVQRYLSGYADIEYHAGFFPDTARPLEATPRQFKFVHLDLDIRASTLAALEWFYPRMVRGGVIVTHDYGDVTVPAVKSAFDAFFADKPETVVPLWFTQAVVTKC
jgi:hypothetical protein